jgi:hypothetical protein
VKIFSALAILIVALPATLLAAGPGEWIDHLLRLPIPEKLQFCGEPVPLDREDVIERLDRELIDTLGNPVRTTLWLKRIPRHFPLIEREIQERGLPEDLKYVALVESNLRAGAVSRARAVGPWQFIRSTGALCGLEQTSWRDERRNWVESTRAALNHLTDLRELLGSWSLALAAYNSGSRRVSRALEAQEQSDFYGLRLPRETERYYFRALAAKLIVEDPEAYGIQLEGARTYAPLNTAEVMLKVQRHGLPVAAAANAAGVSYRRFLELNPWLRGDELPRGIHWIGVPANSREGFAPALAQWEADNPEPNTVYYRVRRGDTLTAIARRHNVRLNDLCAWNGLTTRSIIRPGQELMVQTVD